MSPGRSFLRHIEVTFNPPTFCGFSSERERAATSGSHGCGGSGGGGEVRCCCWCWWWWNVLSVGGCAAKHIEGCVCVVGVMKPQELLYAAVDYYIKILIRTSIRQPTKTLPPPEPIGDAARCVLSDASARSERSARVPFPKWWPNLATLSGILKCSSKKTSSSQAFLENSMTYLLQRNMKSLLKSLLYSVHMYGLK